MSIYDLLKDSIDSLPHYRNVRISTIYIKDINVLSNNIFDIVVWDRISYKNTSIVGFVIGDNIPIVLDIELESNIAFEYVYEE